MKQRFEFFRRLVNELGEEELSQAENLDLWFDATHKLFKNQVATQYSPAVSSLVKGWMWSELLVELSKSERGLWVSQLLNHGPLIHLKKEALTVLIAEENESEAVLFATVNREILLEQLLSLSESSLRDELISDTSAAQAMIESLRDTPSTRLAVRVRQLLPELTALTYQAETLSSIEHEQIDDGTRVLPLLDHLSRRVLKRKLAGLEQAEIAIFQTDDALSIDSFEQEVQRLARVRQYGLLSCVRTALIYLDFAKGGDDAQREKWRSKLGIDLTVHNRAARQILEKTSIPNSEKPGVLKGFSIFRQSPSLERLVLALVESHGLVGQMIRGETPFVFFTSWVIYLRNECKELENILHIPWQQCIKIALDCFYLVNICDTAGVREGLLSDELRNEFLSVRNMLEEVALANESIEPAVVELELTRYEQRLWEKKVFQSDVLSCQRAQLTDRLCRLREGRLKMGEPREDTEKVVAKLPDQTIEELMPLFEWCQFWYCEAATSGLSPEAQLKVLSLGMLAALRTFDNATNRPFHISFLPLVRALHDQKDLSTPYRLRLMETLLSSFSIEELIISDNSQPLSPDSALATFITQFGGERAVELIFKESKEASALLTLLPIYETKSSAAFHVTLKALCDLYGLRKDEFDRVSNESLYLEAMNSSRSDKERMLDFVRSGKIVEVGPGGGVILDLLEERFSEAEVIGIDTSHMVVKALQLRKEKQDRKWQIVEADAFEMPKIVGENCVDTVVFCSVLHEIFSYVHYPNKEGDIGRFRLESVRDMLKAAYRTLNYGGRIVIRDGVMPPPATRILRFLTQDARDFFELFCEQFEGRAIEAEFVGEDRVKLSSADAMEFLFTYTWGADSFPYEVREQYGVLTYDNYQKKLLEWLTDSSSIPQLVAIQKTNASYLQDGYRKALAKSLCEKGD